ncbi:Membrane protein involved in the export of O-antigen and teichoic acid [Hyella patelloides LEGE 07179]|uniref:Membrane protein involved in the export of O-antigen and teichoic acid n=1 Tax=Hyella patelloides LEGE 07179 TaxID=945734 RepID=A0A563VZI6_9CYAN|nr:oligosaccharide flippase family protein [Hyella patelloides]VEP16851.1 Membrane protein involved in the export of O-antigen and teichoic acid [Hyella patelloides LEGE 07179]
MAEINATFNKLVKGAGFSFAGQIISTGFKYLTQVILAWILGSEVFGLYTLGMIVYQLGELFSRMGLETGVVRYVSIYLNAEDKVRLKGLLWQGIILPFLSGIVFGITLFLTSDLIAQGIFGKPELTPALKIVAIALPFGASVTVGIFATTGFEIAKYKVYVWELLLPFTNLLIAVSFCTVGWGLWGATVAWLIAVIVSLAATIYFTWSIFPAVFSSKIQPVFESKQLLAFSLPLSFGSFLWLVMLWTDALMLGYFRPAAEVGIYRAASQTALLMTLFTRSLVTIFTPMIAKLYSKGEFEQLGTIFRTASRWSFSLTLPLFLIVVVTGKDILGVFGTEFTIGWLPLIILAGGQLARAGPGGFAMHMLAMSGHQYLKLFGDLLLAITNIGLNILMIPRWGMMGAAVATGISILGINLLRILQVYLVLRIQGFNLGYFKTITAGTIAFLIGFFLRSWLTFVPYFLALLFTAGTIFLVYGTLLWIMGLEEDDLIIFRKMGQRLGLLKN